MISGMACTSHYQAITSVIWLNILCGKHASGDRSQIDKKVKKKLKNMKRGKIFR